MKNLEKFDGLNEIKEEKDALDQSIALNKLVLNLLDHAKLQIKILSIVLIVSILSNIVIVAGFLWYESQFEYETTTTETTTTEETQTVEGDTASITNIDGDQYNDESDNNAGNGNIE